MLVEQNQGGRNSFRAYILAHKQAAERIQGKTRVLKPHSPPPVAHFLPPNPQYVYQIGTTHSFTRVYMSHAHPNHHNILASFHSEGWGTKSRNNYAKPTQAKGWVLRIISGHGIHIWWWDSNASKRPVSGIEHLRWDTCPACEHWMNSEHFGSMRPIAKASQQDQVYNAFIMTLCFSFGSNSSFSLICSPLINLK